MTLIYFILILGITVFIHELGHFIFAKKAGIYVYEFSIGMGPKIYSFKRKKDETLYCLRLFPIGGFVQMAGEEIEDDKNIPKDKKFQSKTWLQKSLTVVAGVMMNFILAIFLFFIIALFNGATTNEIFIYQVAEDSPAYVSGIQKGDQIIKYNGDKVKNPDVFSAKLTVDKLQGNKIDLEIKKENGKIEKISITPKKVKNEEEIVYEYGIGFNTGLEKGFFASIKYAFTKTWGLICQMFLVLGYLITGNLGLGTMSGPVGIYSIVGETAEAGFINLVYLLAMISVNVGVINILPIPAFDGGRLLFLLIEKLRGKPIDAKVENIIHSIFFSLLMILIVVITYNDILRLFK